MTCQRSTLTAVGITRPDELLSSNEGCSSSAGHRARVWRTGIPLRIGAVAAYVAAVELAVIRLRAVLARVAGAWRDPDVAPYLAGATGS